MKRPLSLILAILVVISALPMIGVQSSAAINRSTDITYTQTSSVVAGKIRYVAQQNSAGKTFSKYYYPGYWQDGNGKQGCFVASTSMALSYLGVNMTPKTMYAKGLVTNYSNSWNNMTNSATVASVASSYSGMNVSSVYTGQYVTKLSELDKAINNFQNGNGTYSPPIVWTRDSSGGTHYFLVTKKISGNIYEMVDPISESNKKVKLVTYATKIVYGNGGTAEGTFSDLIQYKKNATTSNAQSSKVLEGRIYELLNLLGGKGSFFNVQKSTSCGVKSRGHGCSNCSTTNIVNATWFKNLFGNVKYTQFPQHYGIDSTPLGYGGQSCYAFACFAQWYIWKDKNSDFIKTKYSGTYQLNDGNIRKYAQTGDVLRLGYPNDGRHSVVFISADKNGFNVLDCNAWGNHNCQVYIRKLPYGEGGYTYFSIARSTKATTAIKKPTAKPSVKLNGSDNIATGTTVNFSWNTVSEAKSYKVLLYDKTRSAIIENKTISGTQISFTLKEPHQYYISVAASNSSGTGPSANSSTIQVHAPLTVVFNDSDGKALSVQKVNYGSSATAPVSPEKEGYLFNGWDKSFNKVTEDITVTATYRRKSFNVNFYDYAGEKIGDTQKVYWGDAATEPEVNLRAGYTFGGWNTAFDCVKSDLKVSMVDYKWYNDNMLVNLNNATAVRDSDGNGYTVNVNVQNNGTEITSGRVIVALKTSNGKLLTTTESAAFSIKKDAKKDFEIFIPYEYAATQVEIYAVEKFSTAIPISSKVAIEIDQGTAWTDWSTEQPPANADYIEKRTEYRYADKKTMKSGVSAIDGWTLSNTNLVSTSNSAWQPTSPATSSYVDGNYLIKKTVETATVYRTYGWYTSAKNLWWYQKNSGYVGLLQVYSSNKNPPTSGSDYGKAYVDTGKTLTVGSNATNIGTVYCINDNGTLRNSFTAGSSYIPIYKGGEAKIYRQVTKKYQYTLWQWGDWSDWSSTAVSESDTRKVETRTVYRYRTNDTTGIENDSGEERTISGNLGKSYAGKEAILFIYRIESASDYTNEYVGQTIIGEDGSYKFTFKLREEPSVNTGDFSVTLGIEGANNAINLETIEAPLPEYTVTFMGADQKVISEQVVKEGHNAIVPETIPEREGYYFRGWDTSTTNITCDTVVNAVYEPKIYSVVYLDWENQTVQMVEYNHGDELENIVIADTTEKSAIGWDQILLGKTQVTENMILIAQFDTKKYTVNFYDYDDNVISSQIVEYGKSALAPTMKEKEHYVFMGWDNSNYFVVTENLDIKPQYKFETTVETPTANLISKTYSSVQSLKLNCKTDGANIYYTTDGSDPAVSGVLYKAPITIAETCEVRFIAKKAFCNDSAQASGCYAINTDDMMSGWMPFDELPEKVTSAPGEYKLKSSVGYQYKDVIATSSIKEMERLESTGWMLLESTWSDYTDWSEMYPDLGDLSAEVETREADDIPVNVYKYSRWKYFDDATGKYEVSYTEKDGYDGHWEYVTSVDSLYISSFVDGKPAYNNDGELWFNQSTVTEYVSAGYQLYRYKTESKTYYKWSDWSTKAPTSTETREYVSDTVYQYLAPNNYIVSIDYSKSYDDKRASEHIIVRENAPINVEENYFDREGYEFDALYKDSELTSKWSMDENTVTKDVTVYPAWKTEKFKVRFLDNDESVIDEQSVEYLSHAKLPADPQRDGYVFVGWDNYTDGITSDCDFIAKYVAEDEYTRVELSRSKISLITGNTSKISVTVTPDSSVDKAMMWYSSNTDVVKVDEKGNLAAVHSGTAVITVVALDTYETDNCVVTVLGSSDAEILPISNSGVEVDIAAKYLLGIKTGENTINKINEKLENTGLTYSNADGKVYTEKDYGKFVGTGTKITLFDKETVIDEVELVIEGDVNGDGVVDVLDTAQAALVTNGHKTLKGAYERAADSNFDDIVDINDYQDIVNKAVS